MLEPANSSERDIQVVVALPLKLIEQVESLVERGYARNRNVLLTAAVESFIAKLEENANVDTQLRAMAIDPEFQSLNLKIAEEFARSDYQAFSDGENATR